MTPIVLTQSLGPSLFIEAAPIGYGLANVYRGAEVSWTLESVEPTTRDVIDYENPAHPYRNAPRQSKVRSYIPVLVRVFRSPSESTLSHHYNIFQRTTLDRVRMQDIASPRLHRILGHDSTALISVEEYIVGTPIRAVLDALMLRDERLPEAHALAIGERLVAFWSAAAAEDIHTTVKLDEVLIDEQGHLRTRPTYREEQSRQDVGAALLVLVDIAGLSAPEEIQGFGYESRSSMFYLGMLLFEMLAGTHPYARGEKKLFELFTRIVQDEAPYLRTRRPDVHPAVATFVQRCLERDPQNRFSNWNDLQVAYRGLQALFPPVMPRDLRQLVHHWVPEHQERNIPAVLVANNIRPFTEDRLEIIDVSQLSVPKRPPRLPVSMITPIVDEEAEFVGNDGRPMLRVSPALLLDARPVTKAELERFYFATGQIFPTLLRALNDDDNDTCVFVPSDVATAYATWAGKRVPTEEEWELAVDKWGPERLDIGRIWEWTNTPHEDGGWVVRGGRWRDVSAQAARPANRSFARKPAPDLGFRCAFTVPNEIPETILNSKE